jgi:guanylate kinase
MGPRDGSAGSRRGGKDLLLDIDVQGAEQIKKKLPEADVFIMPPDREKLERRLRNRGLDSEEVICRRLVTASREIENYAKYDYILVNDLLDQSTEDLKAVVLAERLGPSETKMPTEAEKQLLGTAERFRLEKARERVQPIVASFMTPAKPGCSKNKYRGKTNMGLIEAV